MRLVFVVGLVAVAGCSSSSSSEQQRDPSGSAPPTLALGEPRALEFDHIDKRVRVTLRVPVGWTHEQDRPVTFGQPPKTDAYDRPRLMVDVTCDGFCDPTEIARRIHEVPDQLVKRATEMTVYPETDPRSMRLAVSTLARGSIEVPNGKPGAFAVIEAVAPADKLGSGVLDVTRLEGECLVPDPDLAKLVLVRFIAPRSWKTTAQLETLLAACKAATF